MKHDDLKSFLVHFSVSTIIVRGHDITMSSTGLFPLQHPTGVGLGSQEFAQATVRLVDPVPRLADLLTQEYPFRRLQAIFIRSWLQTGLFG